MSNAASHVELRVPRTQVNVTRATCSSAAALFTLCPGCDLHALCRPCSEVGIDLAREDLRLFARRRLAAGQVLFDQGETLHYLYVVRSGTFKTTLTLEDGREQVCGFHMVGDVIGLDAVADGRHALTAVALEDAQICTIGYASLMELAGEVSGLQQGILQLLSRQLVRSQRLAMLLGSMNAQERLAAFLLDLSQRLRSSGYSGSDFHLRMTRAEIGSYLGISLETVSRTFSSLQQQHRLEVDNRHVSFPDLQAFVREFGALAQ